MFIRFLAPCYLLALEKIKPFQYYYILIIHQLSWSIMNSRLNVSNMPWPLWIYKVAFSLLNWICWLVTVSKFLCNPKCINVLISLKLWYVVVILILVTRTNEFVNVIFNVFLLTGLIQCREKPCNWIKINTSIRYKVKNES